MGYDDKDVVFAGAGDIHMEVARSGRDMVRARGGDDRGVVGVIESVVEAGASDSGNVEGDIDGASRGGIGLFDRPKMSDITCSWSSDVLLYERT